MPRVGAPLVREGISLWNVVDADQPQKMDNFKKQWDGINAKIDPPLE